MNVKKPCESTAYRAFLFAPVSQQVSHWVVFMALHKFPHLLKNRFGVWYFRYKIADRDTRFSLNTKDFDIARMLAMKLLLEKATMKVSKFDVVLPGGFEFKNITTTEDFKHFQELTRDKHFLELVKLATNKQSPPTPPGAFEKKSGCVASGEAMQANKLFSECVKLYIAEKKHDNSEKTIVEKQATFDEFKRFFKDVDVALIKPDQAIAYKNRMIAEGFSALRINKRMGFLRDLFNYAINNNLYFAANPFATLNISRKSKLAQKVQSYEAFTDAELKAIFESKHYKSFMNKPDYYWLPILALYTGARIEELASLKTEQIKHEDGIWYFRIEKAKNRNSIRIIPLHPNLINLGFLTYFENVKNKALLFPYLINGVNGYSKNCSRRFSLYLDKIGLTDKRKVFHSFRATFINRMTYLNIHAALIMAIVGHYEQSKLDLSSAHFSTYQQTKPILILFDAIKQLTFNLTIEKS